MKKIDFKKMASIKGGKFFGNATKCGGCYQGTRVCQETFFVFWIPFSKDPMEFPCA